MCFYSKTKKLKTAIRPIKVYKRLNSYSASPIFGYIYHKGMNIPNEKIININPYILCQSFTSGVFYVPNEKINEKPNCSYWIFTSGVFHAFKEESYGVTEMYIPIGAKYNDGGVITGDKDCRREIISTALYWPKNKFEKWLYNLISKKY